MRGLYWYLVAFLIILLIFRFFSFIMAFAIRFWYVTIPLAVAVYITFRTRKEKKEFRAKTGLDPNKEVKLKQEPKIEVTEEDSSK
ncbi:MAG TPA: hypothetical protein PLD62_11275 [Candidatus Cloacimonadota bacterium]|nr:hypothetical protein [Candidatus Cloacimonadota bacterium]